MGRLRRRTALLLLAVFLLGVALGGAVGDDGASRLPWLGAGVLGVAIGAWWLTFPRDRR